MALLALCGCHQDKPRAVEPSQERQLGDESLSFTSEKLDTLPVVAVWLESMFKRMHKGMQRGIRIVIWEDGTILYSETPDDWDSPLRLGKVTQDEITQLKKDLGESGVLDLSGHCYLVPDAPVMCTLVNVGGRQQLLYWDEVEISGYGINIDPQPHHMAFMKAWKVVNARAMALRPATSLIHSDREVNETGRRRSFRARDLCPIP